MRWLKYIIPEDLKNSLNSNPGFHWLVIVFSIALGIFLITSGIKGIRTQKLRGKYGKVFYGKTAQVLGVLYIVWGIVVPVIAIATKF